MILLDMEMPKNCVECDKIGIRAILECRLIFCGCANCGRHPNCPIKAEIPKNPTNGDVIKAMIPNEEFLINGSLGEKGTVFFESEDNVILYPLDWWNAPYKKGDKDGK